MKNTIITFLILTAFTIICSAGYAGNNVPQKVIVAGKIANYDPEIPLRLFLNRLGMNNKMIDIEVDNEGNFRTTFDTYIPSDGWLTYRTNFQILVSPNDSLYVSFDGKTKNRPELLATIKFGGEDAETNEFISKYQRMYYSNEIYYNWDKKDKAVKNYEPDEYMRYNDTIRQIGKEIYERFVKEYSPNEKSRQWASFSYEGDYYHNISFYANDHRRVNNMGWDNPWDVPLGFYNKMKERLPIKAENLMNAYSLNTFANRYRTYITDKLREKRTDKDEFWNVMPGGGTISSGHITDSLNIYSALEYVEDKLLLQIMLTNYFCSKLEKQDISTYEKFKNIADQYITEPFLKEPLYKEYMKTKNRIEKPELYSEAVLKEIGSSGASEVFKEILEANKGKVIYIDFWATWCGPCLAEMPNSVQAEKDLYGKDVSFIYICLESEKEKYLATVSKYQLGGQHYFLSRKQSEDIRKLFEISGIPFYLLIDKKGVVKEKGSHLRPSNIKHKINELLNI